MPSIDATGDVCNFTNIIDFYRNYAAAGICATVAGGDTVMAMENLHGVVIQVRSTTSWSASEPGPVGHHLHSQTVKCDPALAATVYDLTQRRLPRAGIGHGAPEGKAVPISGMPTPPALI